MEQNKIVRLLDVAFRSNPELLSGDASKVSKRFLAVVSGIDEDAVEVVLKHVNRMVVELKGNGVL